MEKPKKEREDFLKLSELYFQNTEVATKVILHVFENLFEEAQNDNCYLGVVDYLKDKLETFVEYLSNISEQVSEIKQRMIILVNYYDCTSNEKNDSVRII